MKTFSRVAVKTFLAVSALLLLSACPPSGLNVKVYYLDSSRGLVRDQENEVVPFSQADGYRCMNQKDFDLVTEFVRSCIDGGRQ